MGHFRRSRGSAVLVESLARLRRSGRPVELHVAGEVSSTPARKAMLAIPEDLRPSIQFHGHLPWERAMDLLRTSDICLYPFPHAPELEYIFPLKLLEYAALDKWIVSSDLAGARLLLRGYKKVRFCDPVRADEWADAIRAMLELSPDESERSGNEALIQEYDWDRLKLRLVEGIAPLLERATSREVS
jgi:glycosyltransferase involved in cell wall biosynthesis